MARGLFDMLGKAPRGEVRVPGGETGDRRFGRTYARYDGADAPPTEYFAHGGEAEEHDEVSPELKLAAYELLECLDNRSYSDDKGGRAEALAKHLLAFFHLAEAAPHKEGPHEEVDEGEGGEGEFEEE